MRGVEIISDSEGGLVKVVGELDKFLVASNVDPLLVQRLTDDGYNVVGAGPMHRTDEVTRALDGVNAVVSRTDIHLKDPEIFKQRPELVLAMAACRDPEWNDAAMRENGVWGLRVDENTDQVARGVMSVLEALSTGQLSGAMATTVHPHGEWQKGEVGETMFDLQGKTIAIIGFGQVGRKLAMKALEAGMNVVIHNDGPKERGRRHDDAIRTEFRLLEGVARKYNRTIKWAGDMDGVLEEHPDVLSIHTNSENFQGQLNDEAGVVSLDHLRRLGEKRDGKMPPIVLNMARRRFVKASDEEIGSLLDNGTLGFYVSDVFDPKKEKNRQFEHPMLRPPDPRALNQLVEAMLQSGEFNSLPNAADLLSRQVAAYLESVRVRPRDWKMINSPHILGSGAAVGTASARAVYEELLKRYWERGSFPLDRSFLHKRHFVEPSTRSGDIAVNLSRGTRRGISAEIQDALTQDVGLSLLSSDAVADFRSGTNIPHERVLHTIVLAQNGRPYDQAVRDVVDRLLQFGSEDVNVIRPVPTSDEQRRILNGMDKYHSGFAAV